MKSTIRLQIPTPCHENWNEMTPVEQGRFCNACSKTVIDFSIMTDQQILDHLAKASGSICGRVDDSQLMRDIRPMPLPPKTKWWMALAMPLLLFFNKSIAQSKTKGKVATTQHQKPEGVTVRVGGIGSIPPPINISGKITDVQGMPVPFAVITIPATKEGTTANAQGEYLIKMASWADTVELEVSSLGYLTDRHIIAAGNQVKKDMVLKETLKELTPVSVSCNEFAARKGAMSVVRTITLMTQIKDTLAQLRQPRFSVAPNPVQRNQQVNVYVKELDNYSLQLINNNGVVLYTQVYKAAKGITQQITLPVNCVPGLYYVRMVDRQTQKQYTNKLIVL